MSEPNERGGLLIWILTGVLCINLWLLALLTLACTLILR